MTVKQTKLRMPPWAFQPKGFSSENEESEFSQLQQCVWLCTMALKVSPFYQRSTNRSELTTSNCFKVRARGHRTLCVLHFQHWAIGHCVVSRFQRRAMELSVLYRMFVSKAVRHHASSCFFGTGATGSRLRMRKQWNLGPAWPSWTQFRYCGFLMKM